MVSLLTRHPDAVTVERTAPRTYRKLPVAFDVSATDEDIKLGIRGQATMCALARAACRALDIDVRENHVTVCDGMLTVWDGVHFADYDLGSEAQDWTENFDLEFPVHPVTFRAVRWQKS